MCPFLALVPPSQDAGKAIGAGILEQWMDLDQTLVRFWESHLITNVIRSRKREEVGVAYFIGSLLPEMTRRGRIELVE